MTTIDRLQDKYSKLEFDENFAHPIKGNTLQDIVDKHLSLHVVLTRHYDVVQKDWEATKKDQQFGEPQAKNTINKFKGTICPVSSNKYPIISVGFGEAPGNVGWYYSKYFSQTTILLSTYEKGLETLSMHQQYAWQKLLNKNNVKNLNQMTAESQDFNPGAVTGDVTNLDEMEVHASVIHQYVTVRGQPLTAIWCDAGKYDHDPGYDLLIVQTVMKSMSPLKACRMSVKCQFLLTYEYSVIMAFLSNVEKILAKHDYTLAVSKPAGSFIGNQEVIIHAIANWKTPLDFSPATPLPWGKSLYNIYAKTTGFLDAFCKAHGLS